jgi:hypothetical protein
MKSLSVPLLAFGLIALLAPAANADPLDWATAVDEGGVWTAELGRDQPGEIRALIGRNSSFRHNHYSINVILNNAQRIELLDTMGDDVPTVRFASGRIVVRMTGRPTGTDKPITTQTCFAWDAPSRTYQPAACP